ncbi:YggS family pyridoxal phosphate-dependent enzyme [Pirellulaceae bacterium SH449]
METSLPQIEKNLAKIRERISEAEMRAGRPAGTVRLIGVTKYVDGATTRALAEAGCLDLAESRPQQLWAKAEQLSDLPIRWHMIGHLQRNKAKRTLEFSSTIHSVDSQRILNQIEQDAHALLGESSTSRPPVEVLIEVNATTDATKTGLSIPAARDLIARAAQGSSHSPMKIVGFMGMSSLDASTDQIRREFELLRETRDKCEEEFGLSLPELSMGMSDDFEIAIACGATMVRIGSKLFE